MSRQLFWGSCAATAAIVLASLPFGGEPLFGQAATVLLLPHLFIGDLFHTKEIFRQRVEARAAWLGAAFVGALLFLGIRQAGSLSKPLFFVYFFGHFWKDLTLVFKEAPAEAGIKGWTGLAALTGFAVVSSGLVTDPWCLGAGKVACWAGAAGLLAVAWARQGRGAAAGYCALGAAVLLVCTAIDARHQAREMIPHFLVVWHFMIWYLFVWLTRPSGARLAGLVGLILAANLLSVAAGLLYAFSPSWVWLRFVYNFDYLAGCWTVMHVTWDWAPKQVRGIRLAVA